MVALARPGVVRLADDRQHFLTRQEAQHRPLEALHRHAQRLLDGMQGAHVAPTGKFQERPQRRESSVAAPHRIAALALEMIEEGQDQRRRDLLEPDRRGLLV